MEAFDSINLAITIGLGVLSLGLSVFAIWLSLRFSDRSDKALDSVKELTNDIRSMMEVSLTHQKDFSSKMLDSILEQNQYGLPKNSDENDKSASIESLVQERLQQSEERITEILEKKILQLTPPADRDSEELKQALRDMRSEIAKFGKTAAQVSSTVVLPRELKNGLVSLNDFPAHYVIVAAVVKSKSKSIDDVSRVASEYNLPEGYEGGVENLIQEGVFSGTLESFAIKREFEEPLAAWVSRNWKIIKRLIDHFPKKTEDGVEDFELETAKEIVF